MKIIALTDLCCNRTRPLTRFDSAIPPPARLRAGALGLPTPPQGGSNGGRREGAFPRRSPQHHRPKTPKTSAGHNRLLPPQGQFAEKQPPRRLSGALLFRPFSWANKKEAKSKRSLFFKQLLNFGQSRLRTCACPHACLRATRKQADRCIAKAEMALQEMNIHWYHPTR